MLPFEEYSPQQGPEVDIEAPAVSIEDVAKRTVFRTSGADPFSTLFRRSKASYNLS
jgi:hypothetical protein